MKFSCNPLCINLSLTLSKHIKSSFIIYDIMFFPEALEQLLIEPVQF